MYKFISKHTSSCICREVKLAAVMVLRDVMKFRILWSSILVVKYYTFLNSCISDPSSIMTSRNVLFHLAWTCLLCLAHNVYGARDYVILDRRQGKYCKITFKAYTANLQNTILGHVFSLHVKVKKHLIMNTYVPVWFCILLFDSKSFSHRDESQDLILWRPIVCGWKAFIIERTVTENRARQIFVI